MTVVDDPTLRGGYGAYPIDDEGVDAREKMLIRNGVLTEYLNHRDRRTFDLEPNAGSRTGRPSPSFGADVEHGHSGWFSPRFG